MGVHDRKEKGERKGEKKGEGKGKKEMKRERGNIHRWEKRGNWPTNPLTLGLLKDEKSRQARAGIPAHTQLLVSTDTNSGDVTPTSTHSTLLNEGT